MRGLREHWARLILGLFGDATPEGIGHFLDTDVQYLYELRVTVEGRVCTVGTEMLWVDSIAELTGDAPIRGTLGRFPFENWYDLATRPGVSVDSKVMEAIWSDFGEAIGLRAIVQHAWQVTLDHLEEKRAAR